MPLRSSLFEKTDKCEGANYISATLGKFRGHGRRFHLIKVVRQGYTEENWRMSREGWERQRGEYPRQKKERTTFNPSYSGRSRWTQLAGRGQGAWDSKSWVGNRRFMMSLKVWPRARLYNTLKSMLGSEFPPLVPKTDLFCLKKIFFFCGENTKSDLSF